MQEPRPHEREQQQRRKQSGPRRRGGLAGNGRPGGANRSEAPVRPERIPGPRELRQRAQALHDLLVQFGAGQHRQQLRPPPARAVVTPALAGTALAQVPGHGHPKGNRQYRSGSTAALLPVAVPLSFSQYLPQFPAPGSATTWRVQGSFRGRERGDLESAQYRLPVLAAQPPDLGNAGAQFQCCVPAVQAPCDEQVEEPLPGFGQRSYDLLKPVTQRCPPGRRVPHCRDAGCGTGIHRLPVDVIDPGRQARRENVADRDVKQPAPQLVRARQLRGITHYQAGGDENVAGGGDCRVSVRP